MRVAAGVLLIIMSLINGLAGLGYVGIGGLAAVGGGAANEVAHEIAKDGSDASELKAAGKDLRNAGTGLMAMGAFLIALLGLQIAAAVFLFTQKRATFIMVVAGLGLAAEFAGITLTSFGILNIFGIVVALFAFLGAKAVKEGGGAAAAA